MDPLSNGTVCLRDAALMQRLGVNAVRVYNVSPDLNHDLCASIFNAVSNTPGKRRGVEWEWEWGVWMFWD